MGNQIQTQSMLLWPVYISMSKKNVVTSTLKTEKNVDIFIYVVKEILNDANILWFEEGSYQGDTDQEFSVIHIYDLDKKIIAVFKKLTGKFVTTYHY